MSTTSSATTPIEINALGQPCPMPLLMLKRELKKLSGKQLFLLKSSDPHSEIDVTRYANYIILRVKPCRFQKENFTI